MLLEKWMGEVVGELHLHRLTYEDLGNKMGCTRAYVSMILSGARTPKNAEQTVRAALAELIAEREQ